MQLYRINNLEKTFIKLLSNCSIDHLNNRKGGEMKVVQSRQSQTLNIQTVSLSIGKC